MEAAIGWLIRIGDSGISENYWRVAAGSGHPDMQVRRLTACEQLMHTHPRGKPPRLRSSDQPPARPRMAVSSGDPTTTDMLHCIRATVRKIQRETGNAGHDITPEVERRLGCLLGQAMVTRSAFDIAVLLGSGAELMMFPDAATLETCAAAVDAAGQRALRCVVWAVRHRCCKVGQGVRRFAVEPRLDAGRVIAIAKAPRPALRHGSSEQATARPPPVAR